MSFESGGLENMGEGLGGIGNMPGQGSTPASGGGLSAGWMEAIQQRGDALIAWLDERLTAISGAIVRGANATFDIAASGINNIGAVVAETVKAPMAMFQGRQGNDIESPARGLGKTVADNTLSHNADNGRPPIREKDLAAFQSVVMNSQAHDINPADLCTAATSHGLSAANPDLNRSISRDEGMSMGRSLHT